MSWKYILLIIVASSILAVVLLVRSHRSWLAQQTPLGTWVASTPAGKVTLQFEGQPSSGTYKQLTEVESGLVREFGRWAHTAGELHLLPIASDTSSATPLGEDGVFRISYVSPTQVRIDGPGRNGELYERAPEGAVVTLE